MIPVPPRCNRKVGESRFSSPAIMALMLASWSELPLWTTMLASEAALVMISEES